MGALQASPPRSYAAAPDEGCAGPPKPRLLDRVREAVRTRHYSRRSILFHGKRHPTEMGVAEVTRAVWLRDGGRCAFMSRDGRRCTERGCLEFHHVAPYAAGGESTADTIQLRCRAHNGYEAERYFGPRKPPVVREARRTRPRPSSRAGGRGWGSPRQLGPDRVRTRRLGGLERFGESGPTPRRSGRLKLAIPAESRVSRGSEVFAAAAQRSRWTDVSGSTRGAGT
jgi:hypothetical protein